MVPVGSVRLSLESKMSLEKFAAKGGQRDVLVEILSRTPLTGILQMSLVSRDMHQRVLDITANDFFWRNWVLNTLHPRHDTDLIERLQGSNPWHYYARLHGLFGATELYSNDWAPSNDGRAGILSRFYPLYSSPEPLTVVRSGPGTVSLIALRNGELGFLSGRDLMDYKFESYSQHQIPGEKYVDFIIIPGLQGKELCLLTNRGRVYRLWTLDQWKDATPVADIEGLWDNEDIVQIIIQYEVNNNKILFLNYRGIVYQYNPEKLKIVSLNYTKPVVRLTDTGEQIYFDNTPKFPQLLRQITIARSSTAYLTNWSREVENNLHILWENVAKPYPLGEAVRGVSDSDSHPIAWTVTGKVYNFNYSAKRLNHASEIPDFVVWTTTGARTFILALPRERSAKLWEAIKDLDKDDIRTLLFSRMISKSFDDVDAVKQFLLREPEEEILPLIPHLKLMWQLISNFLNKPSKELINLLKQYSITTEEGRKWTKPQAAAKLAMLQLEEMHLVPPAPVAERESPRSDEEVLDRETLARETVSSLRKRAADLRIKGRTKMRKNELIDAIIAVLSTNSDRA